MIRRIPKGRQPILTDLFIGGKVEQCFELECVIRVPYVVQGATHVLLATLRTSPPPDLPRRIVRLSGAIWRQVLVRARELQRALHEGVVHRLDAVGVQVAAHEQGVRPVDLLLKEVEQVAALFMSQFLPAVLRLQVRRCDTQLLDGRARTQRPGAEGEHHGDLVRVSVVGLQNDRVLVDELKLVEFVEDTASIRTVAVLHVEGRGVWLRTEGPVVADGTEDGTQEAEVVDLLQTHNVRVILEDLLQHSQPAEVPLQCFLRTPHKVVSAQTETCNI